MKEQTYSTFRSTGRIEQIWDQYLQLFDFL